MPGCTSMTKETSLEWILRHNNGWGTKQIQVQNVELDSTVQTLASSAVGLSLGSNAKSLCKSLSAAGSALGNLSENGTGCFFLMLLKYLLAFSFRIYSSQRINACHFVNSLVWNIKAWMRRHTLETVSSDGVPKRSVIKSNWWTTFFPGNKGFPVKISAKMQPILHMSIAGEYCIEQWNENPEFNSTKRKKKDRIKLKITLVPKENCRLL